MRVIQASENISQGDAISHYMFLISDLLTELNIENTFLSIHLDERVTREVYRPDTYIPQEDDIVLFHASIGGEMFDHLRSLSVKRIMIYHNMTPSKFFKGFDDHLANMLEKGREQLVEARHWIDAAYGVSSYNVQCLTEMGYIGVEKLPFALSFQEFDSAKNERLIRTMRKNTRMKIIFYGRLAPHKCQHDLIKLLAFYRKFYSPHAELYIMGSYNQEERYYLALEALIQELHLSGSVHIEGHVSYSELVSRIHASDAFVCMSEHEGLLVPILECFHAGVPVVAYSAGAIPETMGNAGVCLEDKSLRAFSKVLHTIETDTQYKTELTMEEQTRATDFAPAYLKTALQSLLSKHS